MLLEGKKKRNICITKRHWIHSNLNGLGLRGNTLIHIIGCVYYNHGYNFNCLYTIPLCNFSIAFSHAICVIVKYFGKLLLKTI